MSAGSKGSGGFCGSDDAAISVGVVMSSTLNAEISPPCKLGTWSKAGVAFTFKVQFPAVTIPFTNQEKMSIGVSGNLGENGLSKFSVKFLELIPKPFKTAEPAPTPVRSPLVTALAAGFATAKGLIQPLVQTLADTADYKNDQQASKKDAVKLIMTDLMAVAAKVMSTYMDAKITEEGGKMGCTGKVCQAGEAALKKVAAATLATALAGKNLEATAKKAAEDAIANEQNKMKAKYESFKKNFTVTGGLAAFETALKTAVENQLNDVVDKMADAVEKKVLSLSAVEVIETTYHGVEFEVINAKTFNVNYVQYATKGIEISGASKGGAFSSQVSSSNLLTLVL